MELAGHHAAMSPSSDPVGLHTRAASDLALIRETMDRSGRFTAVSGKGGVAIGIVGALAAWIASRQTTDIGWISVWLSAAVVGLVVDAGFIVAKARRLGSPMTRGIGRRFVFSLTPAAGVAALLTVPLFSAGQVELLPGLWLLHYGAGVLSAGVFSVPAIPAMGACFLVLGTIVLCLPPGWGDVFLGAGFGGLHLVFGALIWRRNGG